MPETELPVEQEPAAVRPPVGKRIGETGEFAAIHGLFQLKQTRDAAHDLACHPSAEEGLDCVHHLIELPGGHLGEKRQGEDLRLVRIGHGKVRRLVAEALVSGKKRQGGGVVDLGLNATGLKMGTQGVAAGCSDDVEVKDMVSARSHGRPDQVADAGEFPDRKSTRLNSSH